MEDFIFLQDYQQKRWHRFREIERYSALLQKEKEDFGLVTDDTEATF